MAVHDYELDTDTVCSLLESEYRRQVLRCLENKRTATLRELAMKLQEEVGESDTERAFRVGLYHNHLPKLADEAMIEWDTKSKEASLTAQGQKLVTYLDDLEK